MGYAAAKCFLVEPTDRVKRFARCFASASEQGKCDKSGTGYHNAEILFDEISSPLTVPEGYDISADAEPKPPDTFCELRCD